MTQRDSPPGIPSADVVFGMEGELARLCRTKDWRETSFGPLEEWSECLRTAATLVVAARFPAMLLWGSELAQIYNDGYRALIGDRHPYCLGQPTRECWPELWELNAPFYEKVVREAKAFRSENQQLTVDRQGSPEQASFEVDLSPVFSTEGDVGGVFLAMFETTQWVGARAVRGRSPLVELQESEARYRALAELSPVASMIIVAERYAYANAEAARLLGFEEARDVVGRSCFDFIPPEDHALVRERMRHVLQEGRQVPAIETRIRRRDGSVTDVEVSSGAVPWDGGYAVQVVILDVTDRKRAERELRLAKESAESASRLKGQLLSTMSHELRTPLNAVIGLSDLVLSEAVGPVNPIQRDNLVRIKSSAWHLVGIIDEILGFSRSETGAEDVRRMEVDITDVARGVVHMLMHDASTRKLSLGYSGMERPVVVRTDPGKVRQILTNLIGNALKYTMTGGVHVELRAGEDVIEFRVRDTGLGIPPDRLDDIFDPFVQVERSREAPAGGTGLGLAISQRLASLLGGEVTVDSVEGEGSTFTLRLPRR